MITNQFRKNLIYSLFFGFFILIGISSTSAQTAPNVPVASATAQLDAAAQTHKNKITKIGRGNDITIIMKNGKTVYGSVTNIEGDLVLINDVDTNNLVEIKYQDIKKVRKSYGVNRDLNGNRIPPTKNKIGILVGTAAILIPIILVVTSLK